MFDKIFVMMEKNLGIQKKVTVTKLSRIDSSNKIKLKITNQIESTNKQMIMTIWEDEGWKHEFLRYPQFWDQVTGPFNLYLEYVCTNLEINYYYYTR